MGIRYDQKANRNRHVERRPIPGVCVEEVYVSFLSEDSLDAGLGCGNDV
jgi:hypothetical protein